MARSSSPETGAAPAATPLVVDVYAEVSCPFTHVGLHRLAAARATARRAIVVRVHAWPLEWINGSPLAPEVVADEIRALREAVAPGLFGGFDPATFPATTIPAFGLAAAAYAKDDATGERASLRIRDALFEEGRDVSDASVVDDLACELGVEPLTGAAAEAAVRADWEQGRTRGVRGSPHFFVEEHDWFCPSLRVQHDAHGFDVSVNSSALAEFYAAVLG